MAQTTKRAIAASLKKLLEQKPLNKITVTDIAEDCEISRHTFYYHFQDIYDLVEWIYKFEGERLLEGKKNYENWQEGMRLVFQYLLENKSLVRNTIRGANREDLMTYLHDSVYQLMYGIIEEKSAGKHISEEHKAFIANFYKYAFVGIMMDWVESGMKKEPEIIISDLSLMIHEEFLDAIDKFSGQKQ